MSQLYIEDELFAKRDFTRERLAKGVYEYCTFVDCDFSKSDLSGMKFMECEFTGCNLSLVRLDNVVLRDVRFKDSKLLGVQFASCNDLLLSVAFDHCILHHASFYDLSLRKTVFTNTKLHEVDFSEADLTETVFTNCDLADAIFYRTNLEKADLASSRNYLIDPEGNRIRKARLSLAGAIGMLAKYDIEIV